MQFVGGFMETAQDPKRLPPGETRKISSETMGHPSPQCSQDPFV